MSLNTKLNGHSCAADPGPGLGPGAGTEGATGAAPGTGAGGTGATPGTTGGKLTSWRQNVNFVTCVFLTGGAATALTAPTTKSRIRIIRCKS